MYTYASVSSIDPLFFVVPPRGLRAVTSWFARWSLPREPAPAHATGRSQQQALQVKPACVKTVASRSVGRRARLVCGFVRPVCTSPPCLLSGGAQTAGFGFSLRRGCSWTPRACPTASRNALLPCPRTYPGPSYTCLLALYLRHACLLLLLRTSCCQGGA